MKDLKFEEPPSSSPAAQAKPAASKPALPRLTNHAAPPPTPVQNKVNNSNNIVAVYSSIEA